MRPTVAAQRAEAAAMIVGNRIVRRSDRSSHCHCGAACASASAAPSPNGTTSMGAMNVRGSLIPLLRAAGTGAKRAFPKLILP